MEKEEHFQHFLQIALALEEISWNYHCSTAQKKHSVWKISMNLDIWCSENIFENQNFGWTHFNSWYSNSLTGWFISISHNVFSIWIEKNGQQSHDLVPAEIGPHLSWQSHLQVYLRLHLNTSIEIGLCRKCPHLNLHREFVTKNRARIMRPFNLHN